MGVIVIIVKRLLQLGSEVALYLQRCGAQPSGGSRLGPGGHTPSPQILSRPPKLSG